MSRGTTRFKALYESVRWRRRRAHQLRTHPFCRMCLEDGYSVAAAVVDHVEPHRGSKELFFLGEIQSLCAAHHDSHKKTMENRGYKFSTAVGLDGKPLDRDHPYYTGLPVR